MVNINNLVLESISIIPKTPKDILKITSSIKYDSETPDEKYIIKTPDQLLKSKIGICYDIVELERYYFNKLRFEFKTFFTHGNHDDPTHTFLIFKDDKSYYWFESSWESYRGIHGPFSNYQDASKYVLKLFNYNKLIEYSKFDYAGMNINQFANYIITHNFEKK